VYEVGQILYRASVPDRSDHVWFDRFRVIKATPKGGWISHDLTNEITIANFADLLPKWVPLDAKFCSVTKEIALDRLKARTRSYLKHCRRRMAEAERRARVLELPIKETPLLRTLESPFDDRW
jgi:hypothetical protein